ncbi:hypothetical protein F5X96DRAFT_672328 [Biscogniauxia mediterranea]|nr:hypothetical protein F5X96DRAFT_672328 [Biscogniauxia mediterranea]
MEASPSKRRVLAPLDANTRSPAAGPRLTASKLEIPRASTPTKMAHLKRYLDQENTSQSPKSIKRPRTLIGEDNGKSMSTGVDSNAADKQSPEDMKRERSGSPTEAGDSSSIFDNSVIDTSQDTTITEPDADPLAPPLVVAPPPPRQRPAMTREEARQKAEILRLRLGLASYKVLTGQTDVPLERLKLKPLPGQASPRQRQQQRHGPPSPELPYLPSPPRRRSIQGDREDEASRLQQQRSKEPGTQRKALPTASPLHRSNSSAGSSQARARTSSPRESSPKLAAQLPTPLNTSIISLREDSGQESSAKGPPSGGLQSGAANGLLSLSRG